jgi:hypothetical protein
MVNRAETAAGWRLPESRVETSGNQSGSHQVCFTSVIRQAASWRARD